MHIYEKFSDGDLHWQKNVTLVMHRDGQKNEKYDH